MSAIFLLIAMGGTIGGAFMLATEAGVIVAGLWALIIAIAFNDGI